MEEVARQDCPKQDGTWRVVFSRALETSDKEQDVQIVPGKWASVAFAMWDGQLIATGEPKEKGSQKAVSSWWYVRADPPPDRSIVFYALLGVAVMIGFQAALVRKIRNGRSSPTR